MRADERADQAGPECAYMYLARVRLGEKWGGGGTFGSICAAPASSVIIDNIVSVSYCQSDKLTCKLIRKLKLAC